MVDAEKHKELPAEAEKEHGLKEERSGCGTPKRLAEACRTNMEIEQYLGKKNSEF